MSPRLRWLRGVPLVLFALALWNPSLPWEVAPVDLVILLDESASVDREEAGDAWRLVAGLADSLGGSPQISIVRFGNDVVLEAEIAAGDLEARALLESSQPPRSLPLDPNGTDLASALDLALELVRSGEPTVVVLSSDGFETRGAAEESLRVLESAGVRVVGRQLRPGEDDPDGWISSLRATPEVRAGEQARVIVHAGGSRRASAALAVTLDRDLVAERSISIQPDRPLRIDLDVEIESSGLHRVDAQIRLDGDRRPENDRREALVHAGGPPRVHLVTRAGAASGSGIGEVVMSSPDEFDRWIRSDESTDLVVLDDIAISDLSDEAWERLRHTVERLGTGLLVLGGPSSFGSGAYRHSLLEEMLPVTVQAREKREPVAVLFLVDTSGSMDRGEAERSRLALARRAIVETLGALDDDDWVGVSTFDVEPRERLAFGHHARAHDRVTAAVPNASGGTRLGPALRHGASRLAGVETTRRLLVLVTDGFVDELDGNTNLTAGELVAAGIELIALAVGSDVRVGVLEALTGIAVGGRLLRVDRVADLPKLMRSEVEGHLEPVEQGPLHPRTVTPLPFPLHAAPEDAAHDWPTLTAAAVTRPRPGVRLYLESDTGTPLFVSHEAGVGRVAILPGGLGRWAATWTGWPGFPAFAAGLVEWLARPRGDPRLALRLVEGPGGLAFTLDSLDRDGDWATTGAVRLQITDPAGTQREVEVEPEAPGLYRGTLAAPLAGAYRVRASVGGRTVVRHALRSNARELASRDASGDPFEAWEASGLIERWTDGSRPRALEPRPGAVSSGPGLAALGLSSYLALLAYERRNRIA